MSSGETEQAVYAYQAAWSKSYSVNDLKNGLTWLNNLASAFLSTKQWEQALDYYQQAAALSREIGSLEDEAKHLGNTGPFLSGSTHFAPDRRLVN